MEENSAGEIGLDQVDAVLAFLPLFDVERPVFGAMVSNPGEFPHFNASENVERFVRALYDEGFILSFDWAKWRDESRRFLEEPGALETADLDILRKLFTTIVRADRFCEGYLAGELENGHVTAILRRLKQIRATLP
ncbi:MAG TPA: DUF6508 domain-containing protein [Armatimonadota bacterium]|nr:DUF6508 domain-containing protein [Armatimonadota bacterium]